MKKILIIMLALVMLAGCGEKSKPGNEPVNKTDKVIDYTDSYKKVLDQIYDAIYVGIDYDNAGDELIGVVEAVSGYPAKAALKRVGYALNDLNNDGVPELLVGSVDSYGEYGNNIYAVYRLNNNEPAFSFGGWYRNSIYMLDNANLYLNGSAGAALSFFGEYTVDEDSELKVIDFYFTDYEDGDESFESIGLYHNKTAVWEANDDNLFEGSPEEFFALPEAYYERTVKVELKPFYDHREYVSKTNYYHTADEIAVFYPVSEAEHIEGSLYWGDDGAEVVMAVADEIKDVTLYTLENVTVNNDGVLSYDLDWSGYYPLIDNESPLKFTMLIPEVLPNMAIAYTNKDGEAKLVTVLMSGMDGSLFLMELD